MSNSAADSQDYDLHAGLGFRLSRTSNLVQSRLEQKLAPFDVSRMEWCVLSGVGLQGVTTPSALADHIGITRQAISRLLVQMRKKAVLEQSFDHKDGRSRQLALTAKGQELLRLCRPLVDENQAHFATKIPEKHRAMFIDILDQLLVDEDLVLNKL